MENDKLTKTVFFGTGIGLFIFILIMTFVRGGAYGIFLLFAPFIVVGIVVYFLFKFLPAIWAKIAFAGLFLGMFYYKLHDIFFIMMFVVYCLLMLVMQFFFKDKHKPQKWLDLVEFLALFLILTISSVFYSLST